MSYQEKILAGLVVDSIAAKFVKKSFTKWGFSLEDGMKFLNPDPDDIRTGAIDFANEFLTPSNPHPSSLICITDERGMIAIKRVGQSLYIVMNEVNLEESFQIADIDECVELVKGSCDELISYSILGYFDGIKKALPEILHPKDAEDSTRMINEFFGNSYPILTITVHLEL